MTRDELKATLSPLLAEFLDLDEAAAADEHATFTELGLTSVAVVDLVLAIEEKTGVHLSPGDLQDAATVGDLLDALLRIARV
jgi:acyl carrier protein